jgi:RNA polymerase sigma-70 factor (ECF subfamily)
LADRAGQGETPAAEELVHRYYPKVYRLVHRMSDGDTDAAEEMAQEIFLKIFSQIQSFRGESSFSTWVYRIAVNACLDNRKRRRRWSNLLILWPFGRSGNRSADADKEVEPWDDRTAADAEALLRGRQFEGAVRSAMASLPDKQRLICHLKLFEELRISEIAAITGLAEGTVKSHLFRATRSLRKRLKDWTDKE